jgi:magnesium chelatase accessory protein
MAARYQRLDWTRDGADWPHRDASRFVETNGLTWHVQVMGSGPVLLLLHGTGASTHSFRDMMGPLSQSFTLVVPDLPGHGFTDLPAFYKLSLDGMARAVGDLLRALDLSPSLAVGHSAGAAIAVRMTLDRMIQPQALISLNGALTPFRGAPNFLFPAIAKALFLNPFTPRLVAKRATTPAITRLVRDIGSPLDEIGVSYYQRLISTPAHVAGALGMMANWRLQGLGRDLVKLKAPITFVACANDKAVPPTDGATLAGRAPQGRYLEIPNLGHLGHEEAPERFVALINAEARAQGV